MKLADERSTGAVEISTFHQLSRGKIGKGPGMGPPKMLAAAATRRCSETVATSVANTCRARRRGTSLLAAKAVPSRQAVALDMQRHWPATRQISTRAVSGAARK